MGCVRAMTDSVVGSAGLVAATSKQRNQEIKIKGSWNVISLSDLRAEVYDLQSENKSERRSVNFPYPVVHVANWC
jgi:hypothetical protein